MRLIEISFKLGSTELSVYLFPERGRFLHTGLYLYLCLHFQESEIKFPGRGRLLHTDLDPATLEEVSVYVDLCSISQLKVVKIYQEGIGKVSKQDKKVSQ